MLLKFPLQFLFPSRTDLNSIVGSLLLIQRNRLKHISTKSYTLPTLHGQGKCVFNIDKSYSCEVQSLKKNCYILATSNSSIRNIFLVKFFSWLYTRKHKELIRSFFFDGTNWVPCRYLANIFQKTNI